MKTILVSLITSLGTVLLPRLSFYVKQKEQDAFRKTIVKAFNFVLILASSVMLYFMIFARETILTLSGSEYLPSILPMILLMPTVLFIGLSNITGIQILTPLGREREVLISIICGAVLDFVLNLVLIGRYGASGAAFATLLAELIVLAVQCVYLKDMLSKVVREISLGKTAAALTAAGIVGGVLKMQLELPSFIMICITGVAFYGVFGMALLLMKEPFILEMWEMVKNMLYKGYK